MANPLQAVLTAFAMKLGFCVPLLTLTAVAVADLSEDARKATELRDKEVQRIQSAYIQKLDQLLAKAKSAGDASAVKEIESLIAQGEGNAPAAIDGDPLKPLLGAWQHSEDSSIWKIENTKEGLARGKYQFSISYDAEKKRVTALGGNWVNYLTFTNDPDVINGSYEENGRTKRFKLTRVK